jgi:hypothetical protein
MRSYGAFEHPPRARYATRRGRGRLRGRAAGGGGRGRARGVRCSGLLGHTCVRVSRPRMLRRAARCAVSALRAAAPAAPACGRSARAELRAAARGTACALACLRLARPRMRSPDARPLPLAAAQATKKTQLTGARLSGALTLVITRRRARRAAAWRASACCAVFCICPVAVLDNSHAFRTLTCVRSLSCRCPQVRRVPGAARHPAPLRAAQRRRPPRRLRQQARTRKPHAVRIRTTYA